MLMKYAHLLRLSVFSYEQEDTNQIIGSFLKFFPFDLDDNKIAVKNTEARGFAEKKIGIIEATLTKNNTINLFLQNLLKNLDQHQKEKIKDQKSSRLDQNFDFFLRFSKDSWIKGNKLELTSSGRCFHLKISIAAFPKKREIALKIIDDLFSQ